MPAALLMRLLIASALVCAVLALAVPARAAEGDAGAVEPADEAQPAHDSFDEDALFRPRDTRDHESAGEQETQRQSQREDDTPINEMTLEQAREAGFIFGSPVEEESRAAATFVAATAGVLVHGAGHWYADEPRTALILLVAEGVSVALVGSALLWRWASDGSAASEVFLRPALNLGVGIFALSYFLDVIGTAQGVELGMPLNSRRTRGIHLQADYHYLNLDGYSTETLQLLSAGSVLDLEWGYVGARTDQDVSLNTALYGVTLGGRPWRRGAQDYLFVEVDGEWLQFSGLGRFRRLSGEARVGVSLGLGHWISHLRDVAVGASLGFGQHWYAFPDAPSADLSQALVVWHIPVETFLHFNATERLHTRLAYTYRQGEFLQTTQSGLGVASLEFVYRSASRIDLVLRARAGGGVELSGGLRLWLWE